MVTVSGFTPFFAVLSNMVDSFGSVGSGSSFFAVRGFALLGFAMLSQASPGCDALRYARRGFACFASSFLRGLLIAFDAQDAVARFAHAVGFARLKLERHPPAAQQRALGVLQLRLDLRLDGLDARLGDIGFDR